MLYEVMVLCVVKVFVGVSEYFDVYEVVNLRYS